MMIACTHGERDCPGHPGQSAHSDSHVGRQHDVSENNLLYKPGPNVCIPNMNLISCCIKKIYQQNGVLQNVDNKVINL